MQFPENGYQNVIWFLKICHDKVWPNRPKSLNEESISVTQMTIMQLLAADIITLEIEQSSNPIAHCKLSIDMETSTPHYLINKFWMNINTFTDN